MITNVGPVHLELVGTLERVAEAKAELIAELPGGAACVVPAAEEALRPHLRSDVRAITFAQWHGSDGDPIRSATRPPWPTRGPTSGRSASSREGRPAGRDRRGGRARDSSTSASRRPTTSPTRWPRSAPGTRSGSRWRSSPRAPARSRSRSSETRRSSFRAAFSSSTTATTPTPCRCAPPSITWPQVAARRDAPRAVAVLGEMRELGADAERFHEEVGEPRGRRGERAGGGRRVRGRL